MIPKSSTAPARSRIWSCGVHLHILKRVNQPACPCCNLRLALPLSALLLMGLVELFTGCRSPASTTPEGVLKSERTVKLTGKEVAVDFYLPRGLKKAPVVVVAHGFSRSR